jgi:cellobiose-specific phosphotransferase system component IIC
MIRPPNIVATQLKILIPVGTAIIIVALVKYARVSTSKPTVNMWCAQTIKPKKPIESIAKIIPKLPKTAFDENLETI